MKHNCTVYINTPENQEKSQTALDEAKTTELWAKAEPRYGVDLTVDEIRGFRDVIVGLFHSYGSISDKEMASLVVLAPDRVIENVSHWYTGSAIEQTFSKAEVRQLHAYFKQLPDVRRIKVRRAGPPDNHMMGYGAIPVGGPQDFLSFYKDPGYPLAFEVVGYYDLRQNEMVTKVKTPLGVEEILEALEKQAEQGSCKTCKWCFPLTEEELQGWLDFIDEGRAPTHECYMQRGTTEAYHFYAEALQRCPYPYKCDGGCWVNDDGKEVYGCLAYQPRDNEIQLGSANITMEASNRHRRFMRDLAEAAHIHSAIRTNKLPELLRKLTASESLPKTLRG